MNNNYYAAVSAHSHIGLGEFANFRGDVAVFRSRKERDDFVERWACVQGKCFAKKITRDEARKMRASIKRSGSYDFRGEQITLLMDY